MRFVHAADIHLDSPRGGLDRDSDAPVDEIQQAPRRALENLVQLCLDEKVDFLLIAGDLYDGDWKDFRTGLFFVDQMRRLQAADIPVFLIAGNHDAANRMTRTLTLPANITLFPAKDSDTARLDSLQVAIHGQSFARAAVLDDLSAKYPAKVSGWFNIGLLHTCGTSTEHERYAPCTPEGLQRRGYDYWALGHVHKRQPLHETGASPIHFPGNLQGRHIRETGAKGCLLVTVDDRGSVATEFRPLDVFRWEMCTVDAGGCERADDVVQRFADRLRADLDAADGRPLAVRVDVRGACRAHQQLAAEPQRWTAELHSAATLVGGGRVWIEKIVRHTSLPTDADLESLDGPMGELASMIRDLQADETQLAALIASIPELATLQSRLPGELTEGVDPLRLTDPAWVRSQLEDVREYLAHRLLTG
jgi:DNA repair exonuclease SbcCD nuclease subunit